MYTEEYEQKGFPIKDFILKAVLVIILVLLLIWLLPKFVAPIINKNTDETTTKCPTVNCDTTGIGALTSQIFADNIERMKDAAISYYIDERLPQNVGDSHTMTLSEMIGKKIIVPLVDKNNKAVDVEASYVKITKLDEEYILKVNIKDSETEDYILVHIGCYTYCDSYVCEKKPEADVPIKGATSPSPSTPVNPTPSTVPSPSPSVVPSPSPSVVPSPSPSVVPSPSPSVEPSPSPSSNPEYLYEYSKTTGIELSDWTPWGAWTKTSCSTKEINCSNSNTSCLKKLQLLKRKEQIGTYEKTYARQREVVKQTGSYVKKSCSKYNYVEINRTIYATTTTTTYTQVNTITTTTAHTVGGWTYQGRGSYSNPPSDSGSKHYVFVGADYSYCSSTCTTLPNYYYDSYTYTGGLTQVSSTVTPGEITSSSETSTETTTEQDYEASCGEYVYKTIPIYGTITVTEKATRTEPLYGDVCYQSTKTRTVTDPGTTKTKWSTYNDRSLLDAGWTYTGRTKLK